MSPFHFCLSATKNLSSFQLLPNVMSWLKLPIKLLLLHLVGCLHYCISDARSHKHQTMLHFLQFYFNLILCSQHTRHKIPIKWFYKYPNIRQEQFLKASDDEEKGNGRTAIIIGLFVSTANRRTYDTTKIRSDSKFAVNFCDHKLIFPLHFSTQLPVIRNVLRR